MRLSVQDDSETLRIRARQSGYTEAEKIEALVLLLAAGGDCLDDIATRQADGGLGRLGERPLPSADALRHFLYACHADAPVAGRSRAARPKRLRFTLFTLAGRLVTHARQLVLRVSAAAERLAGLIAARARLALVAQALPAG